MSASIEDGPEPGALVRRAKAGDQQAWDELVRCHRGTLEWVARRHRLGEQDVADVVQITWMRCVQHLATLRDPECLLAWLLTTCRRESLRRVRELRRYVPQDTTDALSGIAAVRDPDGDPYDQVQREDDATRLYQAMAELPVRQRQVLVGLLEHGEDGYAHASRRMGIPVGSLGPTRRRALDRLRRDDRVRALC